MCRACLISIQTLLKVSDHLHTPLLPLTTTNSMLEL